MKKIILAGFIIISIYSFSQVPGYMGKRLVLNGTFLFGSPEVFGEDPATVKSEKKNGSYGIGLHGYVKAGVDYVISERKSVCLAYKMSRMGFIHEYDSAYNSIKYLTQLNISSIDIGLRLHIEGNIAPIGNFFSYGISMNRAIERDVAGNAANHAVPFKQTTTWFASVFFSYGHHIPIGKFLILTTQLETNLANPIRFILDDGSDRTRIMYRWQKSTWMNFGLGLGYIIH